MSVHMKIAKGMRKGYAAVAQPQADNHIPMKAPENVNSLDCSAKEGRKYPAKPYKDVDTDPRINGDAESQHGA